MKATFVSCLACLLLALRPTGSAFAGPGDPVLAAGAPGLPLPDPSRTFGDVALQFLDSFVAIDVRVVALVAVPLLVLLALPDIRRAITGRPRSRARRGLTGTGEPAPDEQRARRAQLSVSLREAVAMRMIQANERRKA